LGEYYAFLSTLANIVVGPVRDLDDYIGVPAITALLLGLIGATSPCQLSTNVAALAYVSRQATSSRRVMVAALAYTLGKVTVYSLLGLLVVAVGLELSRMAVPMAVVARKALGPLLILVGIIMVANLRWGFPSGPPVSAWLEDRAKREGSLGPFLLGLAFSLAFCPTLFWLFFGILMPLSLSSGVGMVYPGLFALGTVLPLMMFAVLLSLGAKAARERILGMRRLSHLVQRATGAIFVIVGINETVPYWFW
jgi:cytochrome c-type biogenesis protein